MAADTLALMGALERILAEQHPMSVRGAFYAASVAGAVEKTEQGYKKVQRLLVRMREHGEISWRWISDGTRWRRGVDTFSSVDEALRRTAQIYRRSLWDHADEIVEVWLEKEALAGVLMPVTERWAADLMVCRGCPSVSYLHSAAAGAKEIGKPLTIYYLGDLDPSGKDIPRTVRQRLDEFGVDFTLHELAVEPWQVEAWQLPSRPTKKTDTRAAGFSGASVELDAIPPDRLRALVDEAIAAHVDLHQLHVLETVEGEERQLLHELARGMSA